jgi:hypothetical protein
MEKTNLILAFFVAAILAGVFLQYSTPPAATMPSSTKENFMQKEIGMPLNSQGMGPYDQVDTTGASGWSSSEPMPVSQMPVNNPMDTNKLMLMVGNKTSADCCPSTFNTDTGCVCLSEQERRLFASRGGNRA